MAGSGSAHPAPPMRGTQDSGRWQRIGDSAGEPEGSADGVARVERAASGGGVHVRAPSGSEQQCGVLPRVGERSEGT